jgi:methyl-accepting chemotaxis protein WspA
MKHWSIRWRICLSFAVVLSLILVMGAVSHVELRGIERANSALRNRSLPDLVYASELRAAWIMNYSLFQQRMILDDDRDLQRVDIGLTANRALIDDFTAKYEAAVGSGERTLYDQLRSHSDAYLKTQAEIVESDRKREGGLEDDDAELASQFAALDGTLQEIVDFNRRSTDASAGEIAAGVAIAELAILWSVGGALAVAAVCGYLLLRAITQPLRRLLGATDPVGKGDFTTRVALNRRDEFGTVAAAFDQMIDELTALIGQVSSSAHQVNESVSEISATANAQQATATEIALTTTQIGTTSKEISATSRELVDRMQDVSSVAERTADLAGSGQSGLSSMNESMVRLAEAAGSIHGKLAVLDEKAGSINQVVITITKVADQTNLLSLNAAIEAEKAGESGRGFSVLASEIRRLADQTAVATYDIERMVVDIQSAVSDGVGDIGQLSSEIQRGIQDVHNVGEQLSQIIQHAQALAPRFVAVGEGMKAQASGAEQISVALAHLTDASQQTAQSLRRSNEAIGGLNRVADSLRSTVGRFKLQQMDPARSAEESGAA